MSTPSKLFRSALGAALAVSSLVHGGSARARESPLAPYALAQNRAPAEAQSGQPSAPAPVTAPSPSPAPTGTDHFANLVDARGRHCDVQALMPIQYGVLAACGSSGLWIFGFDRQGLPVLLETRELDGDVVGLFWKGDQLWAEINKREVQPIDPHPSSGLGQPSEQSVPESGLPPNADDVGTGAGSSAFLTTTSEPKDAGQVVEMDASGEEAVIALSQAEALTPGQVVEFVSDVETRIGAEIVVRTTVVGHGVVSEQGQRFARIRLGVNERVSVGNRVRALPRSVKLSLATPKHPSDIWETEIVLRPFIALDQLGGGLLMSGLVGRRYTAPWHWWLELDPLAVADADDGRPGLFTFVSRLLLSYEQRSFELGMGLGAQSVNSVSSGQEHGTGLTFAQVARLGAVDGVHLLLRSDLVLFHDAFSFGGLTGTLQIPVTLGGWLLMRGGGGVAGYGFGELGYRALLTGNGTAGSVFVQALAGGAALFQSRVVGVTQDLAGFPVGFTAEESRTVGGLMAGVGLGWRL